MKTPKRVNPKRHFNINKFIYQIVLCILLILLTTGCDKNKQTHLEEKEELINIEKEMISKKIKQKIDDKDVIKIPLSEKLDVDKIKADLENDYTYIFSEMQDIETGTTFYKYKENENNEFFITPNQINKEITKEVIKSVITGTNEKNEILNFDINSLLGLNYFFDNDFNLQRDDVERDFYNILKQETIKNRVNSLNNFRFYNFSYKLNEDIFMVFAVFSNDRTYNIEFTIIDSNLTAMLGKNEEKTIDVSSKKDYLIANNFIPKLKKQTTEFHKSNFYSYVSFITNHEDAYQELQFKDASYQTDKQQKEEILNNLNFFITIFDVDNKEEQEYIKDVVLKQLQTLKKEKDVLKTALGFDVTTPSLVFELHLSTIKEDIDSDKSTYLLSFNNVNQIDGQDYKFKILRTID